MTEVTSRRKKKQTHHFGVPVNRGTRGLFTAEHYNAILETIVVSNEDKITNFEMLMRSREKELEGWTEFHVVREVHIDEIKRKKNVPLLTHWVDNWKVDSLGTRKMKSRLVIKGCQEDPTYRHSNSPTASREMLIMALNIIAKKEWRINTLDVKQAFLQSDDINREVYVIPPPEAKLGNETIWKLRVAVYGLADVSRNWYLTSKRLLAAVGIKECSIESSVFYSLDGYGELDGILVAHVDDFLYAGSPSFLNKIQTFKAKVQVGSLQRNNVTFCTLNIFRQGSSSVFKNTQTKDLQLVDLWGLDMDQEIGREEETYVRSVIGS